MSVMDKIAEERKKYLEQQDRKKNGRFGKKKRDSFLLWGEYPSGWQMIKDSILCIMLMGALIGQVKQIDIAELMAPKTITFVQQNTIAPAQAKEMVVETKEEPKEEIATIVAKVRRLESSGGIKDGCLDKGKINGYGYAQNKSSWMCYDSHDEVKNLVTKWFERDLKERTLAQALCRYNTGTPSDNCEYLENYKKL